MAAALVTALRVGAEGLTATIFNGALVNVCSRIKIYNLVLLHLSETSILGEKRRLRRTDAVESVLGGFVTCVAGALIATDHVDTLAVLAQPVT